MSVELVQFLSQLLNLMFIQIHDDDVDEVFVHSLVSGRNKGCLKVQLLSLIVNWDDQHATPLPPPPQWLFDAQHGRVGLQPMMYSQPRHQ